jgi:hypothetical protein
MSKALFLGAIAFVIGAFTLTAYVALHDDEDRVVMFPPEPAVTTIIVETAETPIPAAEDAPYDSPVFDGSAPVTAHDASVVTTVVEAPPVQAAVQAPLVVAAPAPVASAAPASPGITCGPTTCPSGWECCNQSCGICTPPGGGCTHVVCGQSQSVASIACGPSTCENGTICCDPACGKCISPDEKCTPGTCLNPVTFPVSENCGMATCNVGRVCCNPRCGLCTAPGESCSATC